MSTARGPRMHVYLQQSRAYRVGGGCPTTEYHAVPPRWSRGCVFVAVVNDVVVVVVLRNVINTLPNNVPENCSLEDSWFWLEVAFCRLFHTHSSTGCCVVNHLQPTHCHPFHHHNINVPSLEAKTRWTAFAMCPHIVVSSTSTM